MFGSQWQMFLFTFLIFLAIMFVVSLIQIWGEASEGEWTSGLKEHITGVVIVDVCLALGAAGMTVASMTFCNPPVVGATILPGPG